MILREEGGRLEPPPWFRDLAQSNSQAVTCWDPPPEWGGHEALSALARRLPQGARLLVGRPVERGPAGALLAWPEMTASLYEAGWCVEAAECHSAGQWVKARPDTLVVRGCRTGDEDAILDLFRRSFHHEQSRDQWEWKHRRNPHGVLRISVAELPDGGLVGHYAGYPVRLVDARHGAARILHAHQVGDTMTDPAARHRGRGGTAVLGRLARHFWAAYGEHRMDVHYGFNTATARSFSLRFVPGVRALEPVGVWTAEWRPRGRQAGYDCRPIDSFDTWQDELFDRVAASYGVLVRRDATYLNWRYVQRPGFAYRLWRVTRQGRPVGASVLRVLDGVLWWGDAWFDPQEPSAVPAVLDAAVEATGVASVTGWFPDRPRWWVARLTGLGFRRVVEKDDLFCVYAPFTPAAREAMPRLYYTRGDSDLF